MPKVLSYTPAWLSRPSPGFDVFSPQKQKSKALASHSGKSQKSSSGVGPRRLIAHRGTEIFVAVGNEIRWSDLVLLRERGHSHDHGRTGRKRGANGADAEGSYRVLKVPVTGQISQLIISPRQDYLAIVISHTVHVSVLPDPSQLNTQDTSVLKLKTFHLGPTTHVLEQSPIASVLWHPLGQMGRCLVTVTVDAVIRVWELNKGDRWSFSEPTLAVDLKKLMDAVTEEDDFSASMYGSTKVFSPDFVEMEVASACFGDTSGQEPSGWAAMTLWVAMKAGDVYALCPLLPKKWQASLSLIDSICTSVLAEADDMEASGRTSNHVKQRLQWITEIGKQECMITGADSELSRIQVLDRPTRPGAVPELQGPFLLEPDVDDEADVTDILAIGPVIQTGEKSPTDDWESVAGDEELSVGLICLSKTNGNVHVCLNFNGVEAKWLPAKTDVPIHEDEHLPALITLETIKLSSSNNSSGIHNPLFTVDALSKYTVFITDIGNVFSLSLSSLARQLEEELSNVEDAGTDFRIDLFLEGVHTVAQNLIQVPRQQADQKDHSPGISACIVVEDSDVGYFLLTADEGQPYAVTLDVPDELSYGGGSSTGRLLEASYEELVLQPRSTYQPPQVFWSESALPSFIETRVPSRYKRSMKDEIKLSPATLEIMTEAHRILSHETHQLGLAAADLFRRCERLRDEFIDQIRRTDDVAKRIEAVTEDNDEDEFRGDEEPTANVKLERRLEMVKQRQADISLRHEKLRMTIQGIGGRELSDQERAWMAEVEKVEQSISHRPKDGSNEPDEGNTDEPAVLKRLKEVERLKRELVQRAKEMTGGGEASQDDDEAAGTSAAAVKVPSEFRKAKMAQVMELLDRETALVEATTARLHRLSVQAL